MTLKEKHREITINTWSISNAIEDHSNITIEYSILFHKWMLKEDTENNAEKYANFTDKDMFDAFLKSL